MKTAGVAKSMMIVYLCLSCLAAQAQNWQWARAQTGDGQGYSVCHDASGNVFLAGSFSSPTAVFGTYTLSYTGNMNVALVKYDSNGNVLWAQTNAGGFTASEARCVTTDAAGNAYITGFFTGTTVFGTYTLTSVGAHDIFLVKYSPAGTVLWAVRAGGADNDEGYSVSTDASGNSFITGYTDSPFAAFGTYTLTNSSSLTVDMFIVKYNANGNAVWAQKGVATGPDYATGVSTDNSGNTFVTGFFPSSGIVFGTYTLTNTGSLDAYLVKYDPNGNVLWAVSAAGAGYDKSNAVSTDATGNVYWCGYFSGPSLSFGTTTLSNVSSNNGDDIFIAKYNGSGSLLWAKTCPGNGSEQADAVSTYSGGVFVTGLLNSATNMIIGNYTLTTSTLSGGNMFAANFDTNGNPVYAFSLPGGGGDKTSVSADNACNVWIGSDFAVNPFVLGTTTLTPSGSPTSLFVAKFLSNPNVAIGASSAVSCGGQPLTLQGMGAGTYSWSTGAITSSISVAPTVATVYTVTGFGSCLVQNTATIAVAVGTQPTVTAITSAPVLCAGNSAVLIASGAATYSWNNGAQVNTITVNPSATTVYTVTGFSSGCSNTAVITQTVSICTALEQQNSSTLPKIYPNPAKDILHVQSATGTKFHLQVINALGQTVFETTAVTHAAVHLQEMPAGIYFIKTQEPGLKPGIAKVIKE